MKDFQFSYVSFPPPRLPSWPWQATLIMTVNCYLLLILAKLQFLTYIFLFSYRGLHLDLYTTIAEPFHLTTPELFFVTSIVLSLFAFTAVFLGTRRTPKLWKRMGTVFIFATITIGISLTIFHLRHFSYQAALHSRELAFEQYHHSLVSPYDQEDHKEDINWHQRTLDHFDELLHAYEKKFRIEQK